ncbi:hypothetical protein [Nocardioides secundeburneus]|uniref:hypothetical protein n=1 Tax=Nocardioides sp. C4-1 TaxID=3151851 RepID=UPI003264A7CD
MLAGTLALAPVAAAADATDAGDTAPGSTSSTTLGGTPAATSNNPAEPTPLTAGLWSNTLSGPGAPKANAHQYSYARRIENSTVLVSVTGVSEETSSDTIQVVAATSAGDACGSDAVGSDSTTPGTAFGAIVLVASSTFGETSPCQTAPVLAIEVNRSSSSLEGDLPYTLRIVEEAPVVSPEGDLPAYDGAPVPVVPEPGEPEELSGAASFEDAPTVGTGTYAGTVPEGTERLYRVRLGWGQRFSVRVDLPPQDDLDSSPSVDLGTFDPMHNTFSGGVGDVDESGYYGSEGDTLYTGLPAVAYLARFDGALAVTVPGDYFFSIVAQPAPDDREAVEIPVEVSVEVTGEPGPAPEFRRIVSAPGGNEEAPAGYDPSTPYLVGDDELSAVVGDAPVAAEGGSGGGSSGDATRRTSGLVVGALSLVSLAAGVVLLRRRRPA